MSDTNTLLRRKSKKDCSEERKKEEIQKCFLKNTNSSIDRDTLNTLSGMTRTELVRDIDDLIKDRMEIFIARTLDCDALIQDSQKYPGDHQSQKKKNVLSEKVFTHRNSVLTDLLKISHIRSIYHFFLAVLAVIPCNMMVNDYIKKGSIFVPDHLNFVQWSFGRMDVVALTWMGQFGTAILTFFLLRLWAKYRARTKSFTLFDLLALFVYISIQMTMLIGVTYVIFKFELPPGSSFILTMELVRFLMKIHAFVSFNSKKAFNYEPAKKNSDSSAPCVGINEDCKKTSTKHDPQLMKNHLKEMNFVTKMSSGSVQPRLKELVYFLFLPTLVYRDSYPRTAGTNWCRIFTTFTEVIFCIFYTIFIFERFLKMNVINKDYFTVINAVQLVLANSFTAGLLMLLAFFSFLHSWSNMFGDLLGFADRLFYTDWWNSTSYSEYYRKWNVIVHDWLYNYIYLETFKLTKSRVMSAILVFLISAFFHEYVLCVSFKFFYPVLFVQFGILGVGLHFLRSKHRFGNFTIWLSLMVGNALQMVLYTMEWYARSHCKPIYPEGSLYDFIYPRSWNCTLKDEN